MKKIIALSLSTFLAMPGAVHSKDNSVESRAQEVFERCEGNTKREKAQCNYGGCAAIQRTCYDAEFYFLASNANSLSENIKNPECIRIIAEFNEDIRKIAEKFDNAAILDSTWSGLEIKISAELFRYKSLSALNYECERK